MEEARRAALDWLSGQRLPGGAWPYTAGGEPRMEPTLWAVAAGMESDLSWLDGTTWGWEALLVPALLSGREDAGAARARGLREVLARRSETYPMKEGAEEAFTNTELPGWSWFPGTFGWVEPTAYALLSLRTLGMGDHQRAREAERLLLNRQHADRGWNYGNPRVMGVDLESYVPTTAWAVMALPAGPHTGPALGSLSSSASARPSSLSAALSILALAWHRSPLGELPGHLLMLQRSDGSFGGRCDWTALGAAAIHLAVGGPHVFHLPT